MASDFLITGLPRSGTTLLVAALQQQRNVVALAEPMDVAQMATTSDEFLHQTKTFMARTRLSILTNRSAQSVSDRGHTQGTNFIAPPAAGSELRENRSTRRRMAIEKRLNSDFRLFVKHPAVFTAHAHRLQSEFPLYAVVRNPVAVLASWQTVDLPINRGQLPMGEAHCANLKERLGSVPDVLQRQVIILDWFLAVFSSFPANKVIRYEDLIANLPKVVGELAGSFTAPDFPIENLSMENRYPGVDFDRVHAALKPIRARTRLFYAEH